MKVVDIVQGSPEWYEFRLNGIGASDAPVVLDISPYRTRYQLYREKAGLPIDNRDEGTEFIFAKGHRVEGVIRKQFEELTKVSMSPLCAIHDSIDYMRASLDGFDSNLGVLEAKLVGKEVLAQAKELGRIPEHHYAQMQHQFEVTGSDVGHWFGHDGKSNGVLVTVPRNKDYIEKILEAESTFWNMVRTRTIPAISDRDYLCPEDTAPLIRLREMKEYIETVQAEYEKLKEKLIRFYNHPKIMGAGVRLIKTTKPGNINFLKVPEIIKIKESLNEEYLEQFRGSSIESWTVKLERE